MKVQEVQMNNSQSLIDESEDRASGDIEQILLR
jgi:hypothetical protein